MIWLAAAGACAGLGIVLVIAELCPAPPRLDAALARIHAPARRRSPDRAQPATGSAGGSPPGSPAPGSPRFPAPTWPCWAARRRRSWSTSWPRPRPGCRPSRWRARSSPSPASPCRGKPPAGASLAAAACLWFAPDLDVRAEAARRRRDFTHAFISYLQLVRLARTAGAGTSEALEYAARIGDGWAFARIAAVLEAAASAHEPPWDHLAALGEDIGVPEVSELAGTAEIAGTEGAKIAATLAARTESLRGRMLADTRAMASSRTTTMIVPLTLLGMGFVLLLAWPAFYTLIYTT